MLRFFKSLFGKTTQPEPQAPYKVEVPEPVAQPQCGCGRSASGFCVGLHKLTAEEWAAHPDNPVKPVVEAPAPAEKPVVKKAPAKKKAAAEKTAAKPAAMTATKKRPSKKTPV